MAVTTVAVCAILRVGITCLAFARAMVGYQRTDVTLGCRRWAYWAQWQETFAISRCYWRYKPVMTIASRCRWRTIRARFKEIWRGTSKALESHGCATSTVMCHMNQASWNCVSVRSKLSRRSVASSRLRSRIIRLSLFGAPGFDLEHGKAEGRCSPITTTHQSAP